MVSGRAKGLLNITKSCLLDVFYVKEIDQKKHPMIYKKFHEIDLNIIDEQKLNNRYLSQLPKLEKEMAYQNTFKG